MSTFKTLDDLNPYGKRVLVRCDLNTPMKNGQVSDATRIYRSLPTLKYLVSKGAKVIIMSHFSRPKGRVVAEMSLAPIATALAEHLKIDVAFAPNCIGHDAETAVKKLQNGELLLLENLRFHPGEEANDPAFAAQLAALGDMYINDAFSAAHRAHASTEGLAHLLPAAAGRLMQAELEALEGALEAPEHPVAALVGGAKVSSKMTVIGHLLNKVDVMIIGGGMANTFLHAQGIAVGKSLCEHDMKDAALKILEQAKNAHCEIVLPIDGVVATEFAAGAANQCVDVHSIPADAMMLDIGPKSAADLEQRLTVCKTLLWNGPMGAFEIEPFDAGTNAVARTAAKLTNKGSLLSVAGGGDTVAALANAGVSDDFTYISTAGGAFLEWLEGKTLPGVQALS